MQRLLSISLILTFSVGGPADAAARSTTAAASSKAPAAGTNEVSAVRSREAVVAAASGMTAVENSEVRNARASLRAEQREVTLRTGTLLRVVLENAVGSDISRVEQPVHAHLARAVRVRGVTVLPSGSRINGVVADATRAGKVKGRAHVAVRFESIVPRGEDARYALHGATIRRTAPGTKKADSLKIGLPAAGGAIVGGLIGGKKGAAIGGAAAGGAGTAVVLTTRGKEVRLPRGTALIVRLMRPLTIHVRS